MPINDVELFEFFADVFSQSASLAPNKQTEAKGFCEPSDTLKAECVSLKSVLGDGTDMLSTLRKRYVEEGKADMADATTKILTFLTGPDSDFDAKKERPRRLLDYVYPTV
jgi:hypothetical protein